MAGFKISKGKQRSPVRAVIYGTEGIGKTTLAASFPKPLVIDTEEGSKHVDCDRVDVHNWVELEGVVLELARDSQGYETLVVDSADWAERMLIDHILNQSHKKSIEEFGFGKGYVMLMERVGKFLDNCDALVRGGMNVVFVAHSKVQRTSPPDQTDGFDRWELKLTKQVAPLFKEWCDLLLFCNYKTKLVEGSDGRMKARGGKERVMYAERSAAWDAKNRFGLPEEMPMGVDPLAAIFDSPKRPEVRTPTATASVPAIMTKASQKIAEATSTRAIASCRKRVDELLAEGTLTSDQWACLTDQIDARSASIEGEVLA